MSLDKVRKHAIVPSSTQRLSDLCKRLEAEDNKHNAAHSDEVDLRCSEFCHGSCDPTTRALLSTCTPFRPNETFFPCFGIKLDLLAGKAYNRPTRALSNLSLLADVLNTTAMDEGTLAKFRKRYSTVFTKAHELKSACLDHLRISIVMERVDDGTIYHWNSDPRLTRSDGTTEAWPPPGGLMLTVSLFAPSKGTLLTG